MREIVRIVGALALGLSLPLIAPIDGHSAQNQGSAEKPSARRSSFRMSPGVVCRSIDGYEDYEPLPGATQTSEEKLLVYLRPLGFQTELVDGSYQAHLVPDFQVRRSGDKTVLREKKKAFEYKPTSPQPPQLIYLKNQVSLKGLPPGDYNLTIILHDEIAKCPPATQVVKFRIVPAMDPNKVDKASPPGAQPEETDKAREPQADAEESAKTREGDAQPKKTRKARPKHAPTKNTPKARETDDEP
jgi:hypothetical protein